MSVAASGSGVGGAAQARRPSAVIVGFVGKLPYAGMTLYNLHYVAGLQDLGYRVHYVERVNAPDECYDPDRNCMTSDPGFAARYIARVLPGFGLPRESTFLVDLEGRCHGGGWTALERAVREADFVLDVAAPTWLDALELCPRRAFVDGDPFFTQIACCEAGSPTRQTLAHYPVLFTYATHLGRPDCPIPDGGREWIPTRPLVATRLWRRQAPAPPAAPISCLMHWAAGREIQLQGRRYGHKGRVLEALIDLPSRRRDREFVLAIDGRAPRQRLEAHGWRLQDPLEVTRTLDAYRSFILGSRADLGIAKHAYVASRCGWFSDRALCFLASGRPVLHQETGFSDWLGRRPGVLPFSTLDDLLAALDSLDAEYLRHAAGARSVAEESFEAASVLAQMLDRAGFR